MYFVVYNIFISTDRKRKLTHFFVNFMSEEYIFEFMSNSEDKEAFKTLYLKLGLLQILEIETKLNNLVEKILLQLVLIKKIMDCNNRRTTMTGRKEVENLYS